jgi:hypothetical protein
VIQQKLNKLFLTQEKLVFKNSRIQRSPRKCEGQNDERIQQGGCLLAEAAEDVGSGDQGSERWYRGKLVGGEIECAEEGPGVKRFGVVIATGTMNLGGCTL